MSNLLRTNPDGTPWTATRVIRGKTVLVAAIRKGDQWVEVPATSVVRMANRTTSNPTPKTNSDKKSRLAASLLELTQRYRFGKVR